MLSHIQGYCGRHAGKLAGLFAALLMALGSPVQARVSLEITIPGVAVEGSTDLIVAVPLHNKGDTNARRVWITDARLANGRRVDPANLPVLLGNIGADATVTLDTRFRLPKLDPSRTYRLEIAGHYRARRDDDDQGYRGHRDEQYDRRTAQRFYLSASVHIPPAAPGSASSGEKAGPTHNTRGPYPAIPQPPQKEENENRAPTPRGSQLQTFPFTPQNSVAGPPQPGAAVGITINTQTGGIGNRFPPDPSGVGTGDPGNLVLVTGNLYIKISTDGGTTFTTITNLSTVFGDQPDGGYCCDQVLHYVPSIDRVVWLIQTNQATDAKGKVTGPNRLRIAWAKPSDVVANFFGAWTYFDVTSSFLGLGNDWLDYPDLSTAGGHLYGAVDDVTKGGLVVFRISYADMQRPPGNQVTWDFTDPTKASSAVSSHLVQNASGTMFWAGHNKTDQLRVFSWGDASNQYSWADVGNTDYSTADYTVQAPDGQYWLDPRPKGDAIIGAAVVPFRGLVAPGASPPADQLWFAWNAGRDTNFSQPQIRFAMIDSSTITEVRELQVWNNDYAFAYPALAVDANTSEVAISLMWGGSKKFFMNNAVGFLGDFLVYSTTSSNVTFTANPATSTACDDVSGGKVSGRCTRSGDYLSTRRVGINSSLFGTAGYEVNLVDPTKSTDCLTAPGCLQNERWIVFGRSSTPSPPIK